MEHKNPNKTSEAKDKNMKCAKQKCNKNFIVIKYENINTKLIEQSYKTKSYFKLILNKLNVIKGFTIIYTPLGT
jgi:hypothetical protein